MQKLDGIELKRYTEMKKIYFLIATALLAVTFTSCQKDEEMNEQVNKETNEQDLYGKWQNKKCNSCGYSWDSQPD